MKQVKYILLAAVLLWACGNKDNGGMSGSSDLLGRWSLYQDNHVSIGFDANGNVLDYDTETKTWDVYGTWALDSQMLTITGEGNPQVWRVEMFNNKQVLALWDTTDYGKEAGIFQFFYKNGSITTGDSSTIQGTWDWYFFGEVKSCRIRLVFSGSNFELIIFPWGERYTGTYTYQNGYADLKVTKCYTSRYHGNSDEDTIQFNTDTYEITATWMETYQDWQGNTYPYEGNLIYENSKTITAPFVVVGDGVAYGTFETMGLNSVFHKR